jgi:hypothetical protein
MGLDGRKDNCSKITFAREKDIRQPLPRAGGVAQVVECLASMKPLVQTPV